MPILSMLNSGIIEVSFEAKDHIASLMDLANRYDDRNPDFADLCLIRMSELYPKHYVLTVDITDFSIYRRNKNQPIPIVCPTIR